MIAFQTPGSAPAYHCHSNDPASLLCSWSAAFPSLRQTARMIALASFFHCCPCSAILRRSSFPFRPAPPLCDCSAGVNLLSSVANRIESVRCLKIGAAGGGPGWRGSASRRSLAAAADLVPALALQRRVGAQPLGILAAAGVQGRGASAKGNARMPAAVVAAGRQAACLSW